MTGDSITGAEAQQLGLVMKAAPAADLDAEVEGLADRLALIDPDVLTVNKRIVKLGMELMGAHPAALGGGKRRPRPTPPAPPALSSSQARDEGLRQALHDRDGPFGDGRARVNGPERRDGEGRLVD